MVWGKNRSLVFTARMTMKTTLLIALLGVMFPTTIIRASSAAADVKRGAAYQEIQRKSQQPELCQGKAIRPSLIGTNMQVLVGETTGLLPELQHIVLDYLDNNDSCVCMSLEVDQSEILVLQELQDGKLVGGFRSGDIRIWDLNSKDFNKPVQVYRKSGPVSLLQELPDGRLVWGSIHMYDGPHLELFDPNNKKTEILRAHQAGQIKSLVVLQDGILASGMSNGRIRLWNTSLIGRTTVMRTFRVNDDAITVLRELRDGRLALGSDDGIIRILDWRDGQSDLTARRVGGKIIALQELQNGSLASGTQDGVIAIWDGATFRTMQHCSGITALLELQAGQLASGSQDGSIKIWNLSSLNPNETIITLGGHDSEIYTLIKLKDGRFASGSTDNLIKIWSDQKRVLLSKHATAPSSIPTISGYASATASAPHRTLGDVVRAARESRRTALEKAQSAVRLAQTKPTTLGPEVDRTNMASRLTAPAENAAAVSTPADELDLKRAAHLRENRNDERIDRLDELLDTIGRQQRSLTDDDSGDDSSLPQDPVATSSRCARVQDTCTIQ